MGSTFKDKFKKLLQEAEELAKNTPNKEFEDVNIDILNVKNLPEPVKSNDSVECFDDDEYNKRLLKRITGAEGVFPIILPQYDQMEPSRIEKYRQVAEEQGKPFVLPSIIQPITSRDDHQFEPYILFFSHDQKLFMFPYHDEHFNDVHLDDEDYSDLEIDFEDDFEDF